MSIISLIIMFIAAAAAGAFGTLTGGASLITIPLLIVLGLPPHTAIGTDRFGVMGIGWAGLYKFHQKKLIDYRLSFLMALPTGIGAIVGANVVFSISGKVLNNIIIVTNVLCLLYLALNPGLGLEKRKHAVGVFKYWFGGLLSFIIGFYGGFYGAMSGTLLAYVLIMWFGQTFIHSAANIKLASIFMTTSAATVFMLRGAIDYPLALAMFSGCLCGSYLGAHYSDKIGNVWIKRFFMVVLAVVTLKMILSS
jgi:uncharacterized membrane protein YfcA